MNNQLLIDELFHYIINDDVYINYVNCKKKLENNEEIINVINEIKRLQKIITNTKDKSIEMELSNLYKKLDNYPLYTSYIYYKELLEEYLKDIKISFENYFKDILKI